MKPWIATHQIIQTGGLKTNVMLCPDETGAGPAYTEAEWEATAQADWERNTAGRWTFQGHPLDGRVFTLLVETNP